jgi:hypothetical protein
VASGEEVSGEWGAEKRDDLLAQAEDYAEGFLATQTRSESLLGCSSLRSHNGASTLEPWPGTAAQYKDRSIPGFTQKYHVTKLVWYEPHNSIRVAIARQKEIKSWRRMNLNSEIEGGFIEIP